MGADLSKQAAGPSAQQERMRRLPVGVHKRVTAGWQSRQLQTQLFAVVRHTERADSWSALVNGERWTQTEDFRRWGPVDPPLSDEGLAAAGVVGKRLRMYSDDSDSKLHVVVSSPYFRCVQTAVEICRELGEGSRMLLDDSLGEIYGPAVMGQDEPAGSTRPKELLVEYCRARGVPCPLQGVGHRPAWPEGLSQARRRFALRFLEYVHRGTKAQRNFIIVSHADCVGAALRLMPSYADQVVERTDFGAMFVAQRNSLANGGASPSGLVDIDPPGCNVEGGPLPPPVSDGWHVQTFDLWLRQKKSKRQLDLKHNLRALAQGSRLSEERVAQLLGELADVPLEGRGEGGAAGAHAWAMQQAEKEGFMRGGSRISVSTFLFGSSDVGNIEDVACSRATTMERTATLDRIEEPFARAGSIHGPTLMRNSRSLACVGGSFELVDRRSPGNGNHGSKGEEADRPSSTKAAPPPPVREEDWQPQLGELSSPPGRSECRVDPVINMASSRLFQRRFPGKAGFGGEEGTARPVPVAAAEAQ